MATVVYNTKNAGNSNIERTPKEVRMAKRSGLGKIVEKLTLPNHDYTPSTEFFGQLDVNEIAKDLNLKEEGRAYLFRGPLGAAASMNLSCFTRVRWAGVVRRSFGASRPALVGV